MKTCTQCGRTLPQDQFYRRKAECKACSIARTRRWQAAHAEHVRIYKREAQASIEARKRSRVKVSADPVQREKARARAAQWRKDNPDRHKENARRWVEEHREAARVNARESQRRRRVGRNDEAIAYAEILRGDPCVYCGGAGGTIDHITPVISGGANEWTNLAGACFPCNSRKRHRPLLHYLLAEGGDVAVPWE